MAKLYYLFGYLNCNFSDMKSFKTFHYLEEKILCGDAICTVCETKQGMLLKLNDYSKQINIKPIFSSNNWHFIAFIDDKFNGYFISKDTLLENGDPQQLTGKWNNIVCFNDNQLIGISKMRDLFVIDVSDASLPSLTMPAVPSGLKVDVVACGSDHVLILSSGRVLSKGVGSRGQLGHGDLESISEFKEVSSLGCVSTTVACGFWHSVAVTEAGDVFSWGWNEAGQLGVPSFSDEATLQAVFGDLERPPPECSSMHCEPVMVYLPLPEWSVVKIDCGSRHTACLNEDGQVFVWGWGALGQLGGVTESPGETEKGRCSDYPVLIDQFAASDIRCTQWGTVLTVGAHPDAILE